MRRLSLDVAKGTKLLPFFGFCKMSSTRVTLHCRIIRTSSLGKTVEGQAKGHNHPLIPIACHVLGILLATSSILIIPVNYTLLSRNIPELGLKNMSNFKPEDLFTTLLCH